MKKLVVVLLVLLVLPVLTFADTVTLDWDPVSGASKYEIDHATVYATQSGVTTEVWSLAASVPGEITTYKFVGISPNANKAYIVYAVDPAGRRSPPSNTVLLLKDALDPTYIKNLIRITINN